MSQDRCCRLRGIGIVSAVAIVIFGVVAAAVRERIPAATDAEIKTVVDGNTQFACDLYNELRAGDKNLFFSPYSISTALAMTYGGARGKTADEMAETLHFELPDDRLHAGFAAVIEGLNQAGKDDAFQLTVANALWGQKGYEFKPAFLRLTEQSYHAPLQEVDFVGDTEGARKTINTWVEKQTRDKIKDLIQQGILGRITRLVLTNAIYFKSNWHTTFHESRTKLEPFTLLGGDKHDVPMMHADETYRYFDGDGFAMLEIPYKSRKLAMVILLPDRHDGLTELERQLKADNLRQWLEKLVDRPVELALPKFKTTTTVRLDETLKRMGMWEAFSPDQADFTGMTDKRELFIGAVLHKAYVDVDEKGTEAAAATAVVMQLSMELPPEGKPVVFRADHPFVFMIRDTIKGNILFMGRVTDPIAK